MTKPKTDYSETSTSAGNATPKTRQTTQKKPAAVNADTATSERKTTNSQDKKPSIKTYLTTLILNPKFISPNIYAALAQLVEHVLGKDEAPGSNPGRGSQIFFTLCFYGYIVV